MTTVPEPLDVLTLGETMALLVAQEPGPLEQVQTFSKRLAGADSNVAIGLARLGCPSSWIGRLGDDALGRRVVRGLRAEGVVSHITLDGDAPTGLMLKDHPRPGTSRVAYYRAGSAASRIEPRDLFTADGTP